VRVRINGQASEDLHQDEGEELRSKATDFYSSIQIVGRPDDVSSRSPETLRRPARRDHLLSPSLSSAACAPSRRNEHAACAREKVDSEVLQSDAGCSTDYSIRWRRRKTTGGGGSVVRRRLRGETLVYPPRQTAIHFAKSPTGAGNHHAKHGPTQHSASSGRQHQPRSMVRRARNLSTRHGGEIAMRWKVYNAPPTSTRSSCAEGQHFCAARFQQPRAPDWGSRAPGWTALYKEASGGAYGVPANSDRRRSAWCRHRRRCGHRQ